MEERSPKVAEVPFRLTLKVNEVLFPSRKVLYASYGYNMHSVVDQDTFFK